jgi:hypothetical protein
LCAAAILQQLEMREHFFNSVHHVVQYTNISVVSVGRLKSTLTEALRTVKPRQWPARPSVCL